MVDESTAKQLGRFIGSGLLLIGRIQAEDFRDELSATSSSPLSLGCKTQYYRTGSYTLYVNFRLLDVQTAEVLYTKTVKTQISRQSEPICSTPPEFDEDILAQECVANLGGKFINLFRDHTQDVFFTFEKDREYNDALQKAIVKFNLGEIDKGYQILEEITKQALEGSEKKVDKLKAKSHYNLGMAQYFLGVAKSNDEQLEAAVQNLQKAYEKAPKNETYLDLYKQAKEFVTQ